MHMQRLVLCYHSNLGLYASVVNRCNGTMNISISVLIVIVKTAMAEVFYRKALISVFGTHVAAG